MWVLEKFLLYILSYDAKKYLSCFFCYFQGAVIYVMIVAPILFGDVVPIPLDVRDFY